ncbi:MAG TPA: DegT/DnrJ/EryC1/StrS family aminotransferase [Chitinophagaceae bacterium]|nr:DegT/DnrJ/EryC1/StrS family aminotransferase [Chitinophagaceae bacterium]
MIQVNTPLLDGNEIEYVLKALKEGWISSEGPEVKKFEEQFSQKVGRKHGIAVSNGSVALDLAVIAAGIGPGDEVILPSFTIISPAAAIIRAGAKPVLIDSDLSTWNMNVDQIEEKITEKTKAIIVVHIYGLPADMNPILQVAKKYNLIIIEDAAEMHGQFYFSRPCGSFGHISTFSFYPNKHVTTGEGGMIVCNDDKIADRCRLLRNLGFNQERRFVHYELGWNYRITNLQCALGIAQLERLDFFIAKKRAMGKLYTELLMNIQDLIQLPLVRTEYSENIYWVFGVLLKEKVLFDAQEAIKKMALEGIGCRPFFYPMHLQPVFKKQNMFINEKYKISEIMGERGFYLPSGLALKEEEIITVADKLKKILV